MITKDEFIKLISDHRKQQQRIDDIEKVTGWKIYDSDVIEYGNILFDTIINSNFKEEVIDDIDWFMYADNPKMIYKGEEVVPTIDDLWDMIKDYRK